MHPPLYPDKHPLCKQVRQCSGKQEGACALWSEQLLVVWQGRTAHWDSEHQSILNLRPVLQYMEALVQCHKEHSIAKWWGACNDAKFALTKCLAEEKKVMR
jgi:hypothetical protein